MLQYSLLTFIIKPPFSLLHLPLFSVTSYLFSFPGVQVEGQVVALLVQNLERLDESVKEEADGVHNTLGKWLLLVTSFSMLYKGGGLSLPFLLSLLPL